jgi:hypothetical protein
MEHEKQPPQGELAPQSPEEPDQIIDIRETVAEPTGIYYYEQKYGHDPELLAQNVALGLVVALRDLEATLTFGPDFDTSLHGQSSQQFISDVTVKLTEQERRSAYSSLRDSFATYAGFSQPDELASLWQEFDREISAFLANFYDFDFETRLEFLERYRDTIFLTTCMAERPIDSALDNLPMTYEGGDMKDFDDETFTEFCLPYLSEPVNNNVFGTSSQSGISGQVHQRLILEAHHRFGADIAKKTEEPAEIS